MSDHPTSRWGRLLALALVVGALQGCATARIVNHDALAAGARKGIVHHRWSHTILWGAAHPQTVPSDGACPEGVLKMTPQIGPFSLAARVFTFGLWAPTRHRIVCADYPAVADASWAEPDVDVTVVVGR